MTIKDLLNRGSKPGTHKGEYYVCCPYCFERVGKEDTKFKMGVSVNKKVAHCFRCNKTIRFDGSNNEEDYSIDFRSSSLDELKDSLNNNNHKSTRSEEQEILDLSIIGKPISKEETPFAYQYIQERGITEQEMLELNICCGVSYNYQDNPLGQCDIIDNMESKVIRKWEGRILFPFIENDIVKYVIGRDYIGQEPRYLNSKGDKSGVLYRVGNANTGACILCEGLISAIAARRYTGVDAVCTLGKYPSDIQLTKLKKICKKVYFSYDSDVNIDIRLEVIKSLIKYDFDILVVDIPLLEVGGRVFKDPDDYKEKYMEFFMKAKRFI